VHLPLPLTCTSLNLMPPFFTRSMISMVGYCLMNFVTAALHRSGMAEFTVGFATLDVVVVALAYLDAAAMGGVSGSLPRKATTGHVIIFWMEHSSTKCRTVSPNADCGSSSLVSQPSHATKNCRAS
jgi:hypothetical protein